MSVFIFLTVVQALVAAALVGVVLMQRSEGGGLGIGGNPNGALGARGAADFLTRSTKWLAVAFVALSIALAAVAVKETSSSTVETTLDRGAASSAPSTDDLLGGASTDENADPLAEGDDAPAEDAPEADPLAE
ncbi:preprotein translocase subunit SecG [Erythrobacter sp. YT30]|uniref:preprotein translocase subunit SecG n=1 Tax=Erythrobacter sp. YT30 TaxID=1735012 RepID=UPI00076CC015|nr:preprotein translocase subunit SecG [Erythrobacter sp. YT30]KWV93020.1 preprotein translocase subunit SecG [Erythrobacter sp. YT30]